MSERKTISINPDLFSFSSKTGTRKKRPKTDENGIKVKPPSQRKREDSLKKRSVLKMIRQRQEELYKDLFDKKPNKSESRIECDSVDGFNKDFMEAQEFLENLTQKEKLKGGKNATLKQYPNMTSPSLLYHPNFNPLNNVVADENISLDLPHEFGTTSPVTINNHTRLPGPNYGCLKHGTLPTYRSYLNQTRKNSPPNMVNEVINHSIANAPFALGNRSEELSNQSGGEPRPQEQIQNNRINEGLKRISEMKQTETKLRQIKNYSKPIIKKQKRTNRRTYKIGKSKVFPKVGVLVSNKTIRNNVSTQSQLLKQVPIQDVKKYLMKRGLIKIGSIAPNDVLRKMYESAVMICGEVQNHNPENLLYNFIHGEGK